MKYLTKTYINIIGIELKDVYRKVNMYFRLKYCIISLSGEFFFFPIFIELLNLLFSKF